MRCSPETVTPRALLLLGVLGLFPGCGTSGDAPRTDGGTETSSPFTPDWCKPSVAAGQTSTLIVGEGQTFYRELAENTELFWEKGPQGGHHIWVALRQRGLRMRGTIITIDMEDVEAPTAPRLVNHSRLIYDFDKDEGYDPQKGGFCTRSGLRMQLDNAGGPTLIELHGHHVKITATLNDPDGAKAVATRTVIVKGNLD